MTTTITRRPVTLPSGFTFHMLEVAGGRFMMMNNDKVPLGDETIIHEVNVPSFWMAEYPATQSLWLDLIGGENPSYLESDCRPVEQVSWYDAAAFCNALNVLFGYPAKYFVDEKCSQALDIKRARSVKHLESISIYVATIHFGFRLPSEAEWEYAARGGKRSDGLRYAGSNVLDEVGWYAENSHDQTQPVGLKMPNELGLYDLSGNVFEWCEDYAYTLIDIIKNDDGSTQIEDGDPFWRVLRGGSYLSPANVLLSTYHYGFPIYTRTRNMGFRVVLFTPHGNWPGIQ